MYMTRNNPYMIYKGNEFFSEKLKISERRCAQFSQIKKKNAIFILYVFSILNQHKFFLYEASK